MAIIKIILNLFNGWRMEYQAKKTAQKGLEPLLMVPLFILCRWLSARYGIDIDETQRAAIVAALYGGVQALRNYIKNHKRKN